MTIFLIILGVIACIVIIGLILEKLESDKMAKMSPHELELYELSKQEALEKRKEEVHKEIANSKWGELRSKVICPHCQIRGKVRAKIVKNKKGISGGKAVGAILTGGVSMLGTGLSRKEKDTQAHCGECESTWML